MNIRKLSIAAGSSILSLPLLATRVFAGTSLNPCTGSGTGSDFYQKLCELTTDNLGTTIQRLITIVLILAVIISLAFLIWGGVKWILSGGDKAKVESARGTIVAAIVGLVIAFLSFFILSLLLGLFGIKFENLVLPALA